MSNNIYAVSDLHGQYDAFMQGIEEIGLDENDMLYVIGDAIDRGLKGISILCEIMKRPNMELLLGNHEFMMLNSVDPNGEDRCFGRDRDIWLYYNGGDKTMQEYSGLSREERKELLFWLNRRDLIRMVECSQNKFCLLHSFYIEGYENTPYCEMDYNTVKNIVWKSVYRYDFSTHASFVYDRYDYTFITGHVPVQRIRMEEGNRRKELVSYVNRNLINIDGGCAMGKGSSLKNGPIFLRLNDMKEFPIML